MQNESKPEHVYIALPLMDEHINLPNILEDIEKQETQNNITLVCCVNQPEAFNNKEEKKHICESNRKSLDFLSAAASRTSYPIIIIDKSSEGRGWDQHNYGVGWARKVCMEKINELASDDDIMISLDADTGFGEYYISSVIDTLRKNKGAKALAVPYYHFLSGEEVKDRAILRYEIYMRYYNLNMMRIHSPYAYTAIGSGIALPVRTYRKINGITPYKSGEDFYFMQKIRKSGPVIIWNKEKVFPAARFSDRVLFGTGPAMIKGARGDWSSYPIYHHLHFDEIADTYSIFEKLYISDESCPMDVFLKHKFPDYPFWEKLRKNHPHKVTFMKACHEKIDGLRILQYLKYRQESEPPIGENILYDYLQRYHAEPALEEVLEKTQSYSFINMPLPLMDKLRNLLVNIESQQQLLKIIV